MRCAFFSYQPFLDINPGGQACASAATLDSITPLADVDLIYLTGKSNIDKVSESLRKRFPELKSIRVIQYDPVGSIKKRLYLLIRLLPLSLAVLMDKNVVDLVADVHADSKYDVVHYDLMNWLYVHPGRHASIKPTVCSGMDAYSLAYTVKLKYQQKYYVYLRDWLAAIAFSRFETQYLPRADINHFFSPNDVKYLENCGIQAKYRTTNMPLEQKWFMNSHPTNPQEYHRRILLSGTHSYPWYSTGLKIFFNRIWPRINERYPDASITVHSAAITPEIVKITKNLPKVRLLRTMDDFRDIFKNNDYFIHPLLTGTGQKNRLAIAMAQGLCCIATNAAVCGMGLQPNVDYIPLNDFTDLDADNILKILGNSTVTARIATSGREKIASNFSIRSVGKKLIKIYKEAIATK